MGRGEADRLRKLAKELVGLQPEVILAVTTPSVNAVPRETRSIPIVFTQVTVKQQGGSIEVDTQPGEFTEFCREEVRQDGDHD